MGAEEGLNCHQTYFLFLFVEFVGSNDCPSGLVGCLRSRFKLTWWWFQTQGCAENVLAVARQDTAALGGRGLSARALAGGGSGLGCSLCLPGVQLSQRGTFFPKLRTVISLSQKCLARRGALRLCHGSRFPSPHLSVGGRSRSPAAVGVLAFLTSKD